MPLMILVMLVKQREIRGRSPHHKVAGNAHYAFCANAKSPLRQMPKRALKKPKTFSFFTDFLTKNKKKPAKASPCKKSI